MARRTRHEQKDDVLCLGLVMRLSRGERIIRCPKQIVKGERPHAYDTLRKEPTPRNLSGNLFGSHRYSLVIVSSRLSSTRDTAVHPATCAAVEPFGSSDTW